MIGKTGLHAIRALAALAADSPGRCLDAAAIASSIGAPPNYLGKLLRDMARDGLVESQKGPGGGFRLARDARRIRLLDVVQRIEPVDRWDGCFLGFEECSEDLPCAVHSRWKHLREGYKKMLAETTIADLVPRPPSRRESS